MSIPDGASLPNYSSEWKNAIFQALARLGADAHYQEVANWISERLPQTPPPRYFRFNQIDIDASIDIGQAVRKDANIRAQFQKDVSKVRRDFPGTGKSKKSNSPTPLHSNHQAPR